MPKIVIPLRFLDVTQVAYLKARIEGGKGQHTYKALQELCKFYRMGFRLAPKHLGPIEQSIVGLLYTQGNDEKVRRWALNTIARIGRPSTCLEAVLHILSVSSGEPQVAAAAIAAIYKLSPAASELLRKQKSCDEQMVALAALQHTDAKKLDLSALPVNVETASPELLKLGLLLVGLDRAPPNLLNPRHTNSEMVKALGGHHDEVVSQYTIWAITENPVLGVSDLGIDLTLIERLPANVRAWVFQLISMTATEALDRLEYIELGMRDPNAEARAGLAIGLKGTFFDGIEPLILDWYTTEGDTEVSQSILDHIVRQSQTLP